MAQNDPKWPKMAQNDPKWHCSPRSWNLTCSKTEVNLSSAWVTRLECPKGVKDEVKQARRAKRVAEGHQLEIGAQRAPRFLVFYILYFIFSIEYWILSITKKIVIKFTILILRLDPLNQIYKQQHLNVNEMVGYRVPFDNMILVIDFSCFVL